MSIIIDQEILNGPFVGIIWIVTQVSYDARKSYCACRFLNITFSLCLKSSKAIDVGESQF